MTLTNLPDALKIYDAIRRPFATEVQRRSRDTARLFQLFRLGWENVTAEQSMVGEYPPELLDAMGPTYEEETKWFTQTGNVAKDVDKALKMVEELAAQ